MGIIGKGGLVVYVLLWTLFAGAAKKDGSSIPILEKTIKAIQEVKFARYDLYAKERVKGKILSARSKIKVQEHPSRKVYLLNTLKGLEVLWCEGENKGEAYVYPNAFPYVTLSLDPYKSIMRKNQHHTVFDLGFHFIGKIIAQQILKSGNDIEKHFVHLGSKVINGYDCHHLYYEYPDFKYLKYVSQKGETINSIANKFNVGEYRIREKNPEVDEYYGVLKPGRTLVIPNNYSNRSIIYIDKKSHLPVSIMIYDDEGFYESYDFTNVIINAPIPKEEFSKNFPTYRF